MLDIQVNISNENWKHLQRTEDLLEQIWKRFSFSKVCITVTYILIIPYDTLYTLSIPMTPYTSSVGLFVTDALIFLIDALKTKQNETNHSSWFTIFSGVQNFSKRKGEVLKC